MGEDVLDALVDLRERFDGGITRDQGKLGAVHAVEEPGVGEFRPQDLADLLEHGITEGVSVNIVDIGELVDADEQHGRALLAPAHRAQVIEEAVEAAQTCDRVDIAEQLVVLDGTAEIIGLPVLVKEHHAPAGTHRIAAVAGSGTVLHIVTAVLPREDPGNARMVAAAVLRVDVLLPDVTGMVHVLTWQIKEINGGLGPPGIILLDVTQIDIAAVGKNGKGFIQFIELAQALCIHDDPPPFMKECAYISILL